MHPRSSIVRKRTVVDRFANGNADALIVHDLTDDDLGNLFVYHSDVSHRDPRIWEKLISPEHHERVQTCLTRMQHVNQLAVASRREALEEVRAGVESGRRDESELRLAQAEFDSWYQRSMRFSIRVDMAFAEFKPIRRESRYGSPENDLHELLLAVDKYLSEELDEDELEDTFDSIVARHPGYKGSAA